MERLNKKRIMRIIITEKQLMMLAESLKDLSDSPTAIPEYMGDKVTTTVPVHDDEGNVETGKQPDTDAIGKKLSPQSPFKGRSLVSRV